MSSKPKPPASVTSFPINLVGVFAAIVAFYVLRERHMASADAVLIVCAAGVLPIVLLDVLILRVHRRASTGLDWSRPATPSPARVATKLLGLAATVGPIALAYWVFPEYGDWYNTFWQLLRRFWPTLVVFSLFYTWIVDGQMLEPHDSYWQIGRVLLLHPEDAKRADIANHYRGWLIKAFYLPLFIVFTHNQLGGILTYDLSNVSSSNTRIFHFSTDLVYALDVLYATVGYILSFRIIDTHLRSAEPTMFGWCVALECYMPFWGKVFSPLYLHYEGIGWETWLVNHVDLRIVWGCLIVGFEVIYLLATFAFGVRFSNLTHRGILTNGPYRYTKHPAYIAKNISWWMTTLPFIPHHGWENAVKWSLGLAGVSMIYFFRARTEERHLSKDPTYVEYALWINEHGWLRFLNRVPVLKYLKYKAPVTGGGVSAGVSAGAGVSEGVSGS